MVSIPIAFAIDLTVVLASIFLLFHYGRLSFLHPATPYLFFHVWVSTQRLAQIVCGVPTALLFLKKPVTLPELTRASLLLDLALVVMTTAWLIASHQDARLKGPTTDRAGEAGNRISLKYFQAIILLTVPLGLFGLVQTFTTAHAVQHQFETNSRPALGTWERSTYSHMFEPWLGVCCMGLIYLYGFRKRFVILFALYIVVMLYAGQERWRIVLPCLFLCSVYLVRHSRRWPPMKASIALVGVFLLWLPAKQISRSLTTTHNIGTALNQGVNFWGVAFTDGKEADTQLLDMMAVALTQTDDHGRFYYGGTVLPALYNFVPRPLWHAKPRMNQYLYDISTPERNLAQIGATVTLAGDGYVNAGYPGVIIICFLVAYLLGKCYFSSLRKPYYSIGLFSYLFLYCLLPQPYRDGLISFYSYPCVHLLPLTVIIILHYLLPSRDGISPIGEPLCGHRGTAFP